MKFNENKGITIISLVVTIVVLFVITGVVFTEMNTGDEFKKYQYMRADIEIIKDSILVYYGKYVKIPTTGDALTGDALTGIELAEQDNTNDKYYEVDLSKLGNITLNYGEGNINDKDVYIVNERTQEVYYLKGIEYEGVKHK